MSVIRRKLSFSIQFLVLNPLTHLNITDETAFDSFLQQIVYIFHDFNTLGFVCESFVDKFKTFENTYKFSRKSSNLLLFHVP